MKISPTLLFLSLPWLALRVQAQVANDSATQSAILAALPEGLAAENASAYEIGYAAKTVAFAREGDLEANRRQVRVSLGELTQAGTFKSAPRSGEDNPTGYFYKIVLNVASSNYHNLNTQDIIRLTAALRDGQNFLNGAKSNAITRK